MTHREKDSSSAKLNYIKLESFLFRKKKEKVLFFEKNILNKNIFRTFFSESKCSTNVRVYKETYY